MNWTQRNITNRESGVVLGLAFNSDCGQFEITATGLTDTPWKIQYKNSFYVWYETLAEAKVAAPGMRSPLEQLARQI